MTRKQKRGKILKEFNRLIRAAEGGDYNKSRICFHEAGHCFNVWFNQHGGTLCDVTCVQNGTIDGLTRHWSRRPATRASLRAEIAIKMGGKAAEMLTFGASLGHYADQPEWERKAKAVAETRATWRSLPNGLRTRAELKRRAQPIIAQAYTTAYSILEVWRPLLHKPVKRQLPHWWMLFFPTVTYFLVKDWAYKECHRLGRMKDISDDA